MKTVFERPKSMTDQPMHYCPGCGHSVVHRLVAEVVDELNIREKIIGVAPVGCAVLAYDYWDFDVSEAAHGRTPAVATGIKRVLPDRVVFTYQGDGDLAAIGTAEIIHAANRSENISVIFINNTVYGMTGGQMAPTTLLGQKTTTTQAGRTVRQAGYPIKVCELLSVLEGSRYLERCAIDTPGNILKAKKAIKKSFQIQMDQKGFSLIEILTACPVNWKMKPVEAIKHLSQSVIKYFPLGVIKDITHEN
ncbi:MAG: 2-oxoglutarate oxidoreductase [Spirochaetes bacterium]|nr:2-oxoglutarate oxidoreductase [Spirochaetota bacterium]